MRGGFNWSVAGAGVGVGAREGRSGPHGTLAQAMGRQGRLTASPQRAGGPLPKSDIARVGCFCTSGRGIWDSAGLSESVAWPLGWKPAPLLSWLFDVSFFFFVCPGRKVWSIHSRPSPQMCEAPPCQTDLGIPCPAMYSLCSCQKAMRKALQPICTADGFLSEEEKKMAKHALHSKH